MSVLKIFDGNQWRIVGLQGIQGVTGMVGFTGMRGTTGLGFTGSQGLTGIQGHTGPQIIMNQMVVERTIGITGMSPTGMEALSYVPITGLKTTVNLARSGKILSLLSLKYKNVSAGSHITSFLMQSDGETGPFFSEYISDTRERDEVMYQMTSDFPVGSHDIQAYWKIDTAGKQTQLLSGSLSSVVLEGAYGVTGLRGFTGMGVQGATGALGGPPGVTGLRGLTGLGGVPGATGPGLVSFSSFVKILPMEVWRVLNVDYDVFGEIPVLRFNSLDTEKIETTIAIPSEWNGLGDISLILGAILNTPLSTGAQLSVRLSYKGFYKTSNVSTLAPYYTSTVTKTYPTPTQYDFSEFNFTINGTNVFGYDYIHLIIEKLTGSPDVTTMGVCSSYISHGVSIGMGPAGETGAQGYTGTGGIQGPTGAFGGPQGATGLPGSTGFQGITGIQGLGNTGLQGFTGLVGLTGAFGGPPGSTGTQGITGYMGETGLPGIQGTTGMQGETGIEGNPGYTGTIGFTGVMGETGIQGYTGISGETGIGLQGETGFQGFTGLIGFTGAEGTVGEFSVYNTISRYEVAQTIDEEVWVVSSSTIFSYCAWTRSGTTLTINKTAHGHTAGNRVIIRNTNMDYQVALIDSIATNSFTVTTTNTGGTSGIVGAYSLGFTFSHDGSPKTGGTLSAPTGTIADCQLISMRIRTGSRSSTTYDLVVPASAVNGAGDNTALSNCYVPDFNIRADSDSLSAIAATMVVNNGGSGYATFQFGALGALSRIICLHF
jgi:hypothetical protein